MDATDGHYLATTAVPDNPFGHTSSRGTMTEMEERLIQNIQIPTGAAAAVDIYVRNQSALSRDKNYSAE